MYIKLRKVFVHTSLNHPVYSIVSDKFALTISVGFVFDLVLNFSAYYPKHLL